MSTTWLRTAASPSYRSASSAGTGIRATSTSCRSASNARRRRRAGSSAPRAITSGAVRDGWPRISPDARHVAFLRGLTDDEDEPTRLCLVPIAGGRVRHGPGDRLRVRRRGRMVARWVAPRLHRGGRPATVPRGPRAAARTQRAPVEARPLAGRSTDHAIRLALGRRRPPGSLVAPVRRRRGAGRQAATGHLRRLGRVRHRVEPGRTDHRVQLSSAAGRRRASVDDDLGGRRGRCCCRTPRDPRPGGLGQPSRLGSGRSLDRGDRARRAGTPR